MKYDGQFGNMVGSAVGFNLGVSLTKVSSLSKNRSMY